MADKEIVKVLKIQTDQGEKSVKSLKQEINDLRDALLNTEKGSSDWQDTTKRLVEAQTELKDVMNAGKQAMEASEDSIVGMERKYKALYDTYKLLTEEQRNSPFGKQMAKDLDGLSKKLNETKKNVGNFKDNIGHYSESMMDAFGKLGVSVGGLANPIKAVNAGFKMLSANPILAVLGVLVGLFVKVKDAIGKNEELQLRLNTAMAAFKPIGDVIARVLDTLAAGLVKVIEGASKAVDWISRLLGKNNELLNAEQEIAKLENELIKNKREYGELNAEDEARVAKLREEVALSNDKEEIEKKLSEAKEIQEKINKRNIELAQKEYDIIKKKNEITPSSTEELNKESEALQKVNQERAKGDMAIRKLNSGIKSATKESISGLNKIEDKYKELKDLIAGGKQTGELELSLIPFPSKAYYDKKISEAEKSLGQLVNAINSKFGTQLPNKNPFASYEQALEAFGKLSKKELTGLAELIKGVMGTDLIGKDSNTIAAYYGNLVLDFTNLKYEAEDFNTKMENLTRELNGQKALFDSIGKDNLFFDFEGESLRENIELLEQEIATLTERGAVQKEILEKEIELMKARIALKQYENEGEEELDTFLNESLTESVNQIIEGNELIIQSNEAVHRSYDDIYYSATEALSSILDSTKSLMETKKQYGALDEKETKKQEKRLLNLEKTIMAVNVANVVADTAGGIMGVWHAYALEKVANAETAAATGPAAAGVLAALNTKSLVSAIAQTVGLAATGAAQITAISAKSIANIKGMQADSNGSGSVGASATPQIIDSTPYSYARILQTNAEKEEMLNTPIYVRVTDIENGLNTSNTRNAEVTF